MIQLQLANITLILGAKRIFENLNWEIQDGQKIGLVGANGAGKSSLFKMIEGEYSPELGGSITRARLIAAGLERLLAGAPAALRATKPRPKAARKRAAGALGRVSRCQLTSLSANIATTLSARGSSDACVRP